MYKRFFLLGGILGSFLDGFHTHSGTLAYPHPWHWMMAWWVPLIMGAACVLIAFFTLNMDKIIRRDRKKISWGSVLLATLVFIAVYYSSGFWPVSAAFKTGVFFAVSGLMWYFIDRSWQGLVIAAIISVAGCWVENFLINFGAFYYLSPNIFKIPYWLLPLYMCAALSIGQLARKVSSRGSKRA